MWSTNNNAVHKLYETADRHSTAYSKFVVSILEILTKNKRNNIVVSIIFNRDACEMQELQFALKIFNFFFTSVFVLESGVKMISLGFLRYLDDR